MKDFWMRAVGCVFVIGAAAALCVLCDMSMMKTELAKPTVKKAAEWAPLTGSTTNAFTVVKSPFRTLFRISSNDVVMIGAYPIPKLTEEQWEILKRNFPMGSGDIIFEGTNAP